MVEIFNTGYLLGPAFREEVCKQIIGGLAKSRDKYLLASSMELLATGCNLKKKTCIVIY